MNGTECEIRKRDGKFEIAVIYPVPEFLERELLKVLTGEEQEELDKGFLGNKTITITIKESEARGEIISQILSMV